VGRNTRQTACTANQFLNRLVKLEFHDADTDTHTGILATSARESSRGCRRVQRLPCSACHRNNFVLLEPNTHEDPRRLVRRAIFLARIFTRMSIRDAPHVYTCTMHDKLSCTRLQNYTIGASLMSVSVSVSVSVPWNSSLRHAERHADILAKMSVSLSVSVSAPWNAGFILSALDKQTRHLSERVKYDSSQNVAAR